MRGPTSTSCAPSSTWSRVSSQVICPSGRISVFPKVLSSLVCKNILIFRRRKSVYSRSHPVPHEGRFAIVTDVGYGMRWTQDSLKTRALFCGRRSRVVPTPRRWCQIGGWSLPTTVANKPGTPGRARRKPLKPFACGNAGKSRWTCGD